MTGTVDMWCIVHDGGLLMLLAHLLIRARAWSKCELRVFVVASEKDNTINLKKEVIRFVYDLRINAQVEVVELVRIFFSLLFILEIIIQHFINREPITTIGRRISIFY